MKFFAESETQQTFANNCIVEDSRRVCIIGTGAVTSVGYNAPMTAASVRANLSRFREIFVVDKAGSPIVFSIVEFIDNSLYGLDRLLVLATPAAREAVVPLLIDKYQQRGSILMPVFLGIASSRPGFDPVIQSTILSYLEPKVDITFAKSECFVIPAGHSSGLMGIEKATQLINSHKSELTLVGGVDSYYDPDTLEWLDENKRLHSEENMDGFIPGEGAGFCLLSSLAFANRHNIQPLAFVLSASSSEEPSPLTSESICTGEGLTKAFHEALSPLKEGEIVDWTICNMNGESFRGMEWMYSFLRTGPKYSDLLETWHPADCYGDIGAASGLVFLSSIIVAWQRGYAPGCKCLVWTSSDGRHRSAALIQSAYF